MAVLTWDQRRYESGISCGVFYPIDGEGVVWNGLVSVEETSVGGDSSDHYVDGIKYLTYYQGGNFQAKVIALSIPPAFVAHIGERSVVPGFRLTAQPKRRFNFSYRTEVDDSAYKLHLVYNCLATPDQLSRTTIGETPTPDNRSLVLDATPVPIPGFRDTAHLVLDSVLAPSDALSDLEDVLYGTDVVDPSFPTISELVGMFT